MKQMYKMLISIFLMSIFGVGIVTAEEITVQIDVQPTINLGSNGNIPVTISGNSTFNISNIDPTTITLAGDPVKTDNKCRPMASFHNNVLVVHIETYALQLNNSDTQAILSGQTYDGKQIKGVASVRIIGSKSSNVDYSIDNCIKPSQYYINTPNASIRPIGAIIGPDNTKDEFVTNEVEFTPKDQNGLDAFLSKYNGKILFKLPAPPNSSLNDRYLINVDLNLSSLKDLSTNMQTLGFVGHITFSSEDTAKLAALVSREQNKGLQISPDFILQDQYIPEQPDGHGGFLNAESFWWLRDDNPTMTSVIDAWNYMDYVTSDAEKYLMGANVAIVDGGFWLDQKTGVPLGNNMDYRNSLAPPLQTSVFLTESSAGGPNPGPCSNGNPCPWHGQGAFGIAAAYPGNHYGSAGTGGKYAIPMLIKVDNSWYYSGVGISIAANGMKDRAQVISLSWGGLCNYACRAWGTFSGMSALLDGLITADYWGSIVVVAAGNGHVDITGTHQYPCVLKDLVICVGSVNSTGMNQYNFGIPVDIWAPTDIKTTVTPDTVGKVGNDSLYTFGGTSASAPFVAGVVALMKSLNRGLDRETARRILKETANPSSDPDVGGIVNALKAVEEVRPKNPPIVNITYPSNGATVSWNNSDFYAIVKNPESNIFVGNTWWTVDNSNVKICGEENLWVFSCHINFGDLFPNPFGTHTILAHAESYGVKGSDSITVNVVHNPPQINIMKPKNGDTLYSEHDISFHASAYDPNEDIPNSSITWSSDIDGSLGEGPDIVNKLSVGNHKITAKVTDKYGLTAEDNISVTVLSGVGLPTAKILLPLPGLYGNDTLITFEGEAADPVDGILSGSSLEWYSDQDGFLGTGNTIQKLLSGPNDRCSFKNHVITFKVTDKAGHQFTDQILVGIGLVC